MAPRIVYSYLRQISLLILNFHLKSFFNFLFKFLSCTNSLALDDEKDVSEEVRMLSALYKWSGVVSNNAYGICKL